MAAEGDKKTLGFSGEGMRINNTTLLLTLGREILDYLGTNFEDVKSGKDSIVLQFDKGRHGKFIGIGAKRGSDGKN